jgi:FkbM family methyltransferase
MTKTIQPNPVSQMTLGLHDVKRVNWFGAKPLVARVLAARVVNTALIKLAKSVLPPRITQRLPLNRPRVTYQLEDGGAVILLETLHDAIARDIWHGGGRPTQPAERHKLRVFEQLARASKTCLDIGAYSGFFALVAARANPLLRAIAFEIVPENYMLIVRNVLANDMVERVEPRLCGLAASSGSMKMPPSFGVVSHLSSISIGSVFEEGITVPLSRLDEQIPHLVAPVLIKIDVEGFEADIFRGGERFLQSHKPDVICEILPGAHESCEIISKMLGPLGYQFYLIGDQGLEQAPLEPRTMMRDWLFTPRSLETAISRA